MQLCGEALLIAIAVAGLAWTALKVDHGVNHAIKKVHQQHERAKTPKGR